MGSSETGEGTALTAMARTPQTPRHRPPGAGSQILPLHLAAQDWELLVHKEPVWWGRSPGPAGRIMEGFRVEGSGQAPGKGDPTELVWGRGGEGSGGHPRSPLLQSPQLRRFSHPCGATKKLGVSFPACQGNRGFGVTTEPGRNQVGTWWYAHPPSADTAAVPLGIPAVTSRGGPGDQVGRSLEKDRWTCPSPSLSGHRAEFEYPGAGEGM